MKRAEEDEALLQLGIHVVTDEDQPAVRAECIRVARRVQHAGRKIVGLLPSSAEIGVPAIAVQLGLALAEVTGGTVAFVDANLRWPAISDLAREADSDGAGAPTEVGGGEGPVDGAPVSEAFATRWLRGSLALLTPPRAGEAGAGVPQLARIIRDGSELFAHVLVDLTGFKNLGEHLAAIEMMDGVLVVSRAGSTREDELLRLNHELPPRQLLGVLLLGAK